MAKNEPLPREVKDHEGNVFTLATLLTSDKLPQVFSGTYRNDRFPTPTGTPGECPVAIKKYKLNEENQGLKDKRDMELLMKRELQHENFIHVYHFIDYEQQYRYIAMEYCKYSIADFFNNNKDVIDVKNARKELGPLEVLRQSTEGLAFLHGHGYLHRNLKPSNFRVIGYTSEKDVLYQIKITDFKFAKDISIKTNLENSGTHAEEWYAPECRKDEVKLCWSVDVFVLGMYYFYVLFGGKHPFECRPVQNEGSSQIRSSEKICLEIQNENHAIYTWANIRHGDVMQKLPWGNMEELERKYENAWEGSTGYSKEASSELLKDALRLIRSMMRYYPPGRLTLKAVTEHSLFQPATEYDLYNKETCPGLCLIFCQSKFHREGFEYLLGHENSKNKIAKAFKAMGFVVVSHENLNANQIKTKLEETTQDCKPSTNNEDFNRKDFNSLVVCFLSHGYNGGIYGSDGEKVTIHEAQFFFNSQNCRGFHNKPKVFIVDACRVYDHNALQLIQGFPFGMSEKLRKNETLNGNEIIEAAKIFGEKFKNWASIYMKIFQRQRLVENEIVEVERIEDAWKTITQFNPNANAAWKPVTEPGANGEMPFNKSPVNDSLLVMSTFESTAAFVKKSPAPDQAGSRFINYLCEKMNPEKNMGKIDFDIVLNYVTYRMSGISEVEDRYNGRWRLSMQTPERTSSLRKKIVLERVQQVP